MSTSNPSPAELALRKAIDALLKPTQCYSVEVARALAKRGGADVVAAIYLQHILFWDGVCRRNGRLGFYKSSKEIEEDTGLTDNQQDRVRPMLVEMGFITVDTKMAPTRGGKRLARTTWFIGHREAVIDFMIAYLHAHPSPPVVSVESTETTSVLLVESTETVSVESTETPPVVSVESTETSSLAETYISEVSTQIDLDLVPGTNTTARAESDSQDDKQIPEETAVPELLALTPPPPATSRRSFYPDVLVHASARGKPVTERTRADYAFPLLAKAHCWAGKHLCDPESGQPCRLVREGDSYAKFFPAIEERLGKIRGLAAAQGYDLAWALDTYLLSDEAACERVQRGGVERFYRELAEVLQGVTDAGAAPGDDELAALRAKLAAETAPVEPVPA